MKVRYKINTLRGIFFCLKRNECRLCPRTVFSQTQEIKNVCLKRRFKFVVEKTTNLKPLPVCQERVRLFFLSVFALVRPCFASQKQDRPSLYYASKRRTLSFCSLVQFIWSFRLDPRSHHGNVAGRFRLKKRK